MKLVKCVICLGENNEVPIICEKIGNRACLAILPKIAMRKCNLIKLTKKYKYFIPIKVKELDQKYIETMKKTYVELKNKGELYVKS